MVQAFQSTPSVGRATENFAAMRDRGQISIHALRGEGDNCSSGKHDSQHISIHALRGEGDSVTISLA